MHPAVFLDRDGVIVENIPSYIRTWADVQIFPQALTALKTLKFTPYKIVIVTNQSAVGRGLLTLETAHQINQRLIQTIAEYGGRIDGVFICPHTPEDQCTCRKPQPGLILQAAMQLNLDLASSILIGDALSDLAAGKSAGIRRNILVLTGRGEEQLRQPEADSLRPFSIYPNLAEAVDAEITRILPGKS